MNVGVVIVQHNTVRSVCIVIMVCINIYHTNGVCSETYGW